MVSTRVAVAAVALAAVVLAVSVPVSQAWELPISGGWPFANPWYGVPCVCDSAGNLRAWAGAQIIGTVDISLIRQACSKAGVTFYENIPVYFYSGGNSDFCYGSIRPYYNVNAVVEFAETALFGQKTVWDACYLHGLPGFGGWWGK
ncbi:hypothetical protein WJX84_005650 [Apatococcus fuscideae]|uniref:Uncharacterized protein n=1 Tax=Apatococcus fuscideae TaxID=2026836 RepID=A0AAW1SMZ4_9CHLO